MKKDIGLALQAAGDIKQVLPFGDLAHRLYEEISKQGNGRKDFAYIYEQLRTK